MQSTSIPMQIFAHSQNRSHLGLKYLVFTGWALPGLRHVSSGRHAHFIRRNWLRKSPTPLSNISADAFLASNKDQRFKKWHYVLAALVSCAIVPLGYISQHRFGHIDVDLSSKTFHTFLLKSKLPVSSETSIFTLAPVGLDQGLLQRYNEIWKQSIWSVEVKQPHLQIARAYTPLPPSLSEDNGLIRLLIRQEPNGEVSGYLHRLSEGAKIYVRGPHKEFEYPRNLNEILVIAGGTGIAPALQAAHALSHVDWEGGIAPKIHILWATRKREDCSGAVNDTPRTQTWLRKCGELFFTWSDSTMQFVSESSHKSRIVQALDTLKAKHNGRVSVDYFVDEENTFIDKKTLESFVSKSSAEGREVTNNTSKKMILLSGPDGFVNYLAGSKVWNKGQEGQGEVGGLLKEVEHFGWEIWKL